jgi:hypothetical protein
MAYVQNPIPDNQANQNAPQGQTTPNPLGQMPPQGPTPTGGSSGQTGSGGGTPGVGTSTQFGSNASKLSDYLSANAPQIQSMGNQIAGNLGTQFGQVQGDVNTAAGNFGNAVSAGYAPEDTGLVNQATSNPTQFVQDPNNVSAFQSQLNDAYTGPQNFESTAPYAQIQGEVNQAAQGAGLLNTPAGLSSYLNTNVEANATPGENTLDTALLESNQPTYQAVQQAVQPLLTLPTYLNSATTAADALVAPAQTASQQAQQNAQAALTGEEGTFNTGLTQEEQNAENQVQAYNQAIQQAQGNVATDVPLINQLQGIMGQYGATFNGPQAPWADPNAITIPNQTEGLPNIANVASPQDYATLAALSQLSGSPIQAPISAVNVGEAGTYTTPGAVDQSELTNAENAMQQFITGPNGANNITVPGNGPAFVNAGNTWYNQLLQAMGYKYPGTGPRPAPFSEQGPPVIGGV